MKEIRIQKVLSEFSVSSRRGSEVLIREKKVKINGKIAKIGDKINPKVDIITVCERVVDNKSPRIYIALYKPRGYVTTVRDEHGRKTVIDLVKNVGSRVYPVGRLDKDSEGLLILTNDGDFANFMMSPSKHVEKKYIVIVTPRVLDAQIENLKNPSALLHTKLSPVKVSLVENSRDSSILSLILTEGKNRQIRRMCAALNLQVKKLKRVAIGSIKIGNLKPGKYRKILPKKLSKGFYW
ncbi:MAG: rRNA pseudouridine synthase [Oscillospiraceae bacterium]|jgi:23S rRNA pseudouridine2605 synthase|nr:rRNA pseudouridine synthase [Oscillospiraceae bacterium]